LNRQVRQERQEEREKTSLILFLALLASLTVQFFSSETLARTPVLKNAEPGGSVTIKSDEFLVIPKDVEADSKKPGAAPFVVAKSAPEVVLAFHGDLPDGTEGKHWWSNWGDICVASDGRVYCGIGDHGDDIGGKSYAFLYRWDPKLKRLEKLLDVNSLVKREHGEPTFCKIHAKIDEGNDGRIYFSATVGNGGQANQPQYKWSETLPGGQLYAFDPKTNQTEIITNLPPRRVTCDSLLDRSRNIWWCTLDLDNGNSLWAFDLTKKKEIFRSPEGSVSLNRHFALGRDGSIYFNGKDAFVGRYDPKSNDITLTKSKFPDNGMRCSTHETSRGEIYGITMGKFQLFRYVPASDELTLLGPCYLIGYYTTVCAISPDERFVYYVPGGPGVPLVQYEIASGKQKVIAFLQDVFVKQEDFVPAHPFGLKVSADGSTVYMNYHGAVAKRVSDKIETGMALNAFTEIRVPASER
jgi:sugar lactone lactonase YvrE